MAQENPLRNRVFYGTPDGVALDRGSAEAWRNAQAPRPAPAASPVPPTKPAALSRAGSVGKWAGRVGGVAGVATEALRLADVGKDGKEAVYAELPRSAGRLGGAWAGAQAGGALGAMTGPLAPVAAPVGTIAGGALGYAYGGDAVDAAKDVLPRIGRGLGSAMAEVRNAGREGGTYPARVASTAQALFGGRAAKAFADGAQTASAPAAPVSLMRNRPGADWRAPMQLPAGSAPVADKGVPRVNIPGTWSAPMKLSATSATQGEKPADAPKPQPPEERTQSAAESGQAARYAAAPDVVRATGANDANMAEAAGIRSAGRVQDYSANARSTITGNALDGMRGDTAELQRRMYNDLTSYSLKGFPGLRAARAEMWNNLINQANGVTAKGADNAAAADMQGMQDANTAQRSFSDRRAKTDMFNVDTAEARRAGDLDRAVTREGNYLSAASAGARRKGAGEDPQTFAEIAKGYGGDLTAASQSVLRNRAAAGEDLSNDPLSTMALTNISDGILASNGRMQQRGLFGSTFGGAGADGPVDPNPLNYERQQRGWWDRAGSALWPWGVGPNDVLYKDSQGNERYFDQPIFSEDPVLDKQIRDRVRAGFPRKE